MSPVEVGRTRIFSFRPSGQAAVCAIVIFCSLSPRVGQCEESVALHAELYTGIPLNLPAWLVLHQCGWEKISVAARFSTRPFRQPLYYGVRIGRSSRGCGWEVEFIHHKLYLDDAPAEIQSFSISHGYNLFLLNRLLRRGTWILRPGAGIVVAHPESTVRERRFDEKGGLFDRGYYPGGPVLALGLSRRSGAGRGFYLMIEGKLAVSYVHLPIEGGSADLVHWTLLFNAGLGWGR